MPDPKAIQKPAVPQKPAPPEPVIKTMPEKYIGAPAGKPPVIREVVETKVRAVPPPPQAPVNPSPKKSRRLTLILGVGLVLAAGIGAAAYVALTPAKPAPPVNANKNLNLNANSNANANLPPVNSNANANLANANSNANANVPPPPPNTGVDSDSDGLTDIEENSIYGTNPYNTDSDKDTFNDGNEVAHLYDPMKRSPAALKDSASFRVIDNAAQGYEVLVPAKWAVAGEGTPQLLAAAPTGEFFEVLVTEKPKAQSLVEWYLAMSPGAAEAEVERVKTLQGYDALRSPDRLTTYVDAGDGRVFTLTYSFDGQSHLEFRTTYDAFVGSFAILKK